jgi:uncharacterized protein (TIRG00374 family)
VSDLPSARPASSKLRPSRTHLSTAFVVLVLAAMVWLAATKMNLSAAGGALSHASLPWVAIAVVSVAVAFLARAESWFIAVRAALPESRLGRPVVARSLMIGVATSSVTPARVGEAVRTWILSRRAGGHCATVLGTVVSQTLMNLIALGLLAMFVLSGGSAFGFSTEMIVAAIAVPVLLLAALVAAGRLIISTCPAGETCPNARLAKRVGCWFSRQVADTGRGMAVFSDRRCAVHSIGAQLGAWMLQGFACYAILMALGLHASATAAAAVLLAVNLSAIVPVTPANVGLFQAACIAVLTPLGISGGHALAYGLLLQGVEMGVAIGMGVPAMLGEGLSLRELGRASSRGGLLAVAEPLSGAQAA